MSTSLKRAAFVGAAALFVSPMILAQAGAAPLRVSTEKQSAPAKAVVAKTGLPLTFEPNKGQLPAGVAFLGRASGYSVEVDGGGLLFHLPGDRAQEPVRLNFAGSHGHAPMGQQRTGTISNYYFGSDPAKWRTGIANYSRVGVAGLYPGVDAEFYGSDGQIEHDFVLAPNADPASIAMELEGGGRAELSSQGDLSLARGEGSLIFRKPVAYQVDGAGIRVPVAAEYVLCGEEWPQGKKSHVQDIRLRVGAYDRSRKLVIDPVIVWATYVTGSNVTTGTAMTTDAAGDVFLTGTTNSTPDSFGVTGDVTNGTSPGVFVAKLASADLGSNVEWITFFGGTGSGVSTATSIAYAAAGNKVFVGGTTTASNFPFTAATLTVTAGASPGFIAEFDNASGATAGAMTTATYVSTSAPGGGGTPVDAASDRTTVAALATDAAGNVFAAGSGNGLDLPAVKALPGMPGGGSSGAQANFDTPAASAFVVGFQADLRTQLFGSYIGADQAATGTKTKAAAIGLDAAGGIYVGGATTGRFPYASAFPASGIFVGANFFSAPGGNTYGFLAKIAPATGSGTHATMEYSVSLQDALPVTVSGLAVDGAHGTAFIGGSTGQASGSPTSHLLSSVLWSDPATAAGAATMAAFPGPRLQSGATPGLHSYVLAMPPAPTGATPTPAQVAAAATPAFFTYLAGNDTTGDTVQGLAFDGNGASPVLQVAGATSSSETSLPAAGGRLPSSQTTSSTSAPFQQAFVYTLAPDLATAYGRSFLGSLQPAPGQSANTSAPAVGVDGQGNAYVLVDDQPFGAPSSAFVSRSAAEAAPASGLGPTSTFAYVAEIAGTTVPTASTGLNIAVAAGSPSPDPVGYATASLTSTVTYTWDITAPTTGATNVVVNVTPPAPAYLTLPYTVTPAISGVAGGSCSASNRGGVTCIIPALAAGETAVLTLGSTLTSSALHQTGNITLSANVADDAGNSPASSTQTSHLSPPSVLTASLTAPASNTVNALATGATVTTGSSITYKVVIANAAGAGDAKTASFTVTPPTDFVVTSSASSIAGTCDATGGTGCSSVDIPAGGTLTYSITGSYTDTGAVNPGSATNGNLVVSGLTGFLDTPPSATLPTRTSITRAVSLILAVAASPAGSSTVQTTFNLAAPIAFQYKIANAGPSDALGVNLTGALAPPVATPGAFVAAYATGSPCPGAAIGGCAIATTITPTTTPVAVTLNADFPDIANGAVPLTASSKAYTVSGSVSAAGATLLGTGASAADTVTIQRAAHLAIVTTAQAPVSKVAFLSSSTTPPQPGTQAVSFTFTITNTGPDMTTGQDTLSSVLPAMPLFTPSTTAITIGAASCSSPFANCVLPSLASGSSVTATVTGVFLESAANAVVGAPGSVATYNATAALVNAVDSDPGDAAKPSVAAPTVTVERSSQLVTVKTASLTAGVTALRLAETTDGAGLAATTVSYAISLSNVGLDDAAKVIVTDSLPPWFTVVGAPTIAPTDATLEPASPGFQCVDGASHPIVAGYQTVGAAVTISCSGIALVLAPNSIVYPTGPLSQTISYSGKFVDNGYGVAMNDIVPQNAATATVTDATRTSTSGDYLDTGTTQTSAPSAPYTVQRVAHAQIVAKNGFFMRTNLFPYGTVLPTGNPVPATPDLQAAQCDPLALVAAGAPDLNPVNCSQGVIGQDPGNGTTANIDREMTFEVTVSNTGPNIATHTVLDLTAGPLAGFVVESVTLAASSGTNPTAAITGSLASTVAIDGLYILPGQTLDYIVKGYFGAGTIGKANFAGQLTTSAYRNQFSVGNPVVTYIDVPPAAGTPNFQSAQAIVTVSNTPSASTSYSIKPWDGNLNQPATVTFTTVTKAGITGVTDNPGAAPALPGGVSPDPPDIGATIPLYRWGNNGALPVYFGLGTTAAVTGSASNQTGVCLNVGLYPVTFDKPARVLLWGLTNVPGGTAFNAVPNFAGVGIGDISNSSQASTFAATEPSPESSTAIGTLCGRVNGFPAVVDGNLTGASAGQMAVAALEPVNFAPVVTSGALVFTSSSQQQGKGVGAASGTFSFNFGSKSTTYDYNDADPCFIGGVRATCNDNTLTSEWGAYIFGGGNFVDSSTQLLPISLPADPQLAEVTVPVTTAINLPAGMNQTYVVVADQVGSYYYHLTGTGGDTACDPGVSSGDYTPIPVPAACPIGGNPATGSITGTVALPGESATMNYFHEGVGATEELAQSTGGATGVALIELVLPVDPAAVANSGATAAHAAAAPTISAGQSVGFAWNWLTETSAVAKNVQYTLACVAAGSVPASAGVTCSVQPATFTYSSSGQAPGPPAIYVSTTAASTAGLVTPESAGRVRMLAILLPLGLLPLVVFGRNRKALRGLRVLAFVAAAGALAVFSGCGSNGFHAGAGTGTAGTPAGPYTFYATATPAAGSGATTLYTYEFSVVVK